jgi:glucuronate isomerase
MPFIHEDFLLSTKTARKLYHQYAEAEPIFDYHCHLSPRDIAANRQFKNLFEIWLEGDHYKWRAMRTNGVAERFCTGRCQPIREVQGLGRHRAAHAPQSALSLDASGIEALFRHHDLLDEKTADKIWKKANEKLATPELTAQGILKKFKVKVVCTTDDPVDSLEHHRAFAAQGHPTKMLPAFRPDKALTVNQPAGFNGGWNSLPLPATWTSTAFPRSSPRCESATTFSIRRAAVCPITA